MNMENTGDLKIDQKKIEGFYSDLGIDNIEFIQLSYRKLKNPEPHKYSSLAINFQSGKGDFQNNLQNGIIKITLLQDFHFELHEFNPEKQEEYQILFQMNLTVLFRLRSRAPMDEELFTLFQRKNMPFIIHPYLRELVSNVLFKAGLPPLILPLYFNQI